MIANLLPVILVLLCSTHYAKAQFSTISVGPLLACSITTFACPNVSGCCTIGGCCGSGCCANGYTCINEGTSAQACCPANDPTKCGTVTPSSNTGSSGSGSGTCTTIQNCPRDPVRGLAWTCVLGKQCGLSYNQCRPCPYIGGSSSDSNGESSSESGSDSESSSDTSSSFASTTTTSTSSASRSTSSSGGAPSFGSTPASSRANLSYNLQFGLGLQFIITFVVGVLLHSAI